MAPGPCLDAQLVVGASTEPGTWEERLGCLEGDSEPRLSPKVSPGI